MFLLIAIIALAVGVLCHFCSNGAENGSGFLLAFFATIFYVICVFMTMLFIGQIIATTELKQQDIAKDLDTQIYYIKGYVDCKENENKDNDYYEFLIQEVEHYNKIYNNYKKNCEVFNITPKEEFANYQKMIYNYNNNTITWEDGTSIFKGENNND